MSSFTYRKFPRTKEQQEIAVKMSGADQERLAKEEKKATDQYAWISLHWREFDKRMDEGECRGKIMECVDEIFGKLRGQLYDVIESTGIVFSDSTNITNDRRVQGDAIKDLIRGFIRQAEENIKDFPYLHIKE